MDLTSSTLDIDLLSYPGIMHVTSITVNMPNIDCQFSFTKQGTVYSSQSDELIIPDGIIHGRSILGIGPVYSSHVTSVP